MKSFKTEFIDFLKWNDAYEKYCVNFKELNPGEDVMKSIDETLPLGVLSIFDGRETPEGYGFWNSLEEDWHKRIWKRVYPYNKREEFVENLIHGDLFKLLESRNIKSFTILPRYPYHYLDEGRERKTEIDFIVTGEKEIMAIEIEENLTIEYIDKFIKILKSLNRRLPEYANPHYPKRNIYGGVGYLKQTDNAADYAEENGLFVFKAFGGKSEDSIITNAKDFRPKEFENEQDPFEESREKQVETKSLVTSTIIEEERVKLFFYLNESQYEVSHIHARYSDGVATFWLEPAVLVQKSKRLNSKELAEIRRIIIKHQELLKGAYCELINPKHKK